MYYKITNRAAAAEAQRLAHDLATVALSAVARLPQGPDANSLLGIVGLRLTPERKAIDSSTFRVSGHPELVELMTEIPDSLPGLAAAVSGLVSVRTEDLGGLTAADMDRRRHLVLADLADRRDRLRKPLGKFLSHVPRAVQRRDELEAARLNAVRATLSGQPLPAARFTEVAAAVLYTAGLTGEQMPDLTDLQSKAERLYGDLIHRAKTIVAWVSDAIAEDIEGLELDLLDPGSSRERLRRRTTTAEDRRDAKQARRAADDAERERQEAVAGRARLVRLEEDRKEKAARLREVNLRAFNARRKIEKVGMISASEPERDNGPKFVF